MPEHTGHGECIEAALEHHSVAVEMLLLTPVTENIRCVRLATGQVVYDFWTDGKRLGRIDADAYDAALSIARGQVQDEAPAKRPRVRTREAFDARS